MGTIAQKLEYLNDTRLLLKDNINKINNVLTDESTFRSYPQELFNGYLDVLNNGTDTLWNNLEKVSASGEEATLENVETAPIKMVLNGNTIQDTTSGKNLQAPLSSSTTMNGVTFTPIFEDGMLQYVNVNGTSTSVAYVDLPDINFSAGTYVMTGSPSGGSDSNYQQRFVTGTSNLGTDNGNGVSVTLNEATSCHVRIRIASGYTANNLKFYPMVRLSSVTDATYEPYTNGASPSPDYPQQVKVVKGENVVSVSGKNKIDLTKHTNTLASNTTILNSNTYQCEVTASWQGKIIVPLDLKNNSTYTISASNDSTATRSIIDKIYGYNGATSTTIVTSQYFDYFKNGYRFNSGEYERYEMIIYITGNSSQTGLLLLKDLMIELGSTVTDFVPYSKTDYPINLGDIELCKINTYKDYFHKDSGKWYVHKRNNKHLLKPTSVILEENGIRARYTVPIPVNSYPPAYCNYFGIGTKYSEVVNTSGNTPNLLNINATGNLLCNVGGYTTATEYIDFFANNDIYLYYPLATPTETEITDTTLIEQLEAISKAKSVKDKTYITQTNEELPFILDVEAIKEYEVN